MVKRTLIAAVALLICVSAGTARAGAAYATLGSAPGISVESASSSCADPVTGAPSGPAVVSATSTAFGRALVIGAGSYAGCSLYLLTSDQFHSLSGAAFACSDNANALGAPCDSVLWPALLTNGRPLAGPGINPTLLGTVTRDDLPGLPAVQQVTYAGHPLYRFLFDETPGETEGANLFDPVTSPAGTWYLVDPSQGLPATGRAQLQIETAPLKGTGPAETVLAATMNDDFSVFPNADFPVYTLSTDGGHASACQEKCALTWQPVLTSGPVEAGAGVDEHALGIIVRPDGTHQATYNGKPLYQFVRDAYIAGIVGTPGIFGAGASTPFGVFSPIAL